MSENGLAWKRLRDYQVPAPLAGGGVRTSSTQVGQFFLVLYKLSFLSSVRQHPCTYNRFITWEIAFSLDLQIAGM